jgi:CRP-like cAMP-binding protein
MAGESPSRTMSRNGVAPTVLPSSWSDVEEAVMEAKERMVRGLELFSGCSRDEVHWVLRNGDLIDVRPGSVIARRGGYAREFMVVVGGSARATNGDGSHVTLLPGAFFGHEEIAADRPNASTIEAMDGLRVLVFEVRAFRGFADRVPTAAGKLNGDRTVRAPAPVSYRRRLAVAS